MICTQLLPGHLSLRVGDSLQHSEEIGNISNCAFQCDYYAIILIDLVDLLQITSSGFLVQEEQVRGDDGGVHAGAAVYWTLQLQDLSVLPQENLQVLWHW